MRDLVNHVRDTKRSILTALNTMLFFLLLPKTITYDDCKYVGFALAKQGHQVQIKASIAFRNAQSAKLTSTSALVYKSKQAELDMQVQVQSIALQVDDGHTNLLTNLFAKRSFALVLVRPT